MKDEIKKLLGKKKYSFDDLIMLMAILRSEVGCPWDIEQTHESIKMDTIEEAYEVLEAINLKDTENIKEELGDLLLHVVFHSQIAKDEGTFTIEEVVQGIVTKLIRRHPHVFAKELAETADDVLVNWESIKATEKSNPKISQQMEMVPKALPALIKSRKIQKKAAKIGFDFHNGEDAFNKLDEEVCELKEAVKSGVIGDIEEEFGDLLFSMVNISRFFSINPEIALTNATEKFINRFRGIEALAENSNLKLEDMTLEEMDQLWNKYKDSIKNQTMGL